MPSVFITCSVSNSPVWTGMTVASRTDLDKLQGPFRDVVCTECTLFHEWDRADAYLDGEPMNPPPGSIDRPNDEGGGELAGST